jgi:hypothetical protein
MYVLVQHTQGAGEARFIKSDHFKGHQVHQKMSVTGVPKWSFIKALTKHKAAYSPLLLDKLI